MRENYGRVSKNTIVQFAAFATSFAECENSNACLSKIRTRSAYANLLSSDKSKELNNKWNFIEMAVLLISIRNNLHVVSSNAAA